jgi:hypothetical protein
VNNFKNNTVIGGQYFLCVLARDLESVPAS